MQDYFVGRQPILDRQYKTVAYELLFRAVDTAQQDATAVEMTAKVLVGGLLDLGIHKLSGSKPVYVKAPRDFLVDDVATLFQPEALGVEIQEGVSVDDELLAACRRLRDRGYKLILNNYDGAAERQALLDVVDVVKIDMRNCADIHGLATALRQRALKLMATKVESLGEHDQAQQLGFDYFRAISSAVRTWQRARACPVRSWPSCKPCSR